MLVETWFRCLTKKVTEGDVLKLWKSGEKDYVWYEMGFFTNWTGEDRCRILCIGIPRSFASGFEATSPQSPTPSS